MISPMIRTLINLLKRTPRKNINDLHISAPPPPDPKWKKPVEIRYNTNSRILTVTTLDRNVKEYQSELISTIDGEQVNIKWRRFPSFTLIKDKALIQQLDGWFWSGRDARKTREGWVKSL